MWWGLIRSSWLIFLCACNPIKKPKLYLASSLASLEPKLNKFDLNFMSSADILKQIEHGAPCDAIWLADEQKWQELKDKNLVGDVDFRLKNRLALVGNTAQKMDFVSAINNLVGEKPLIIADSFVPLGSYTEEVLKSLGLHEKLSKGLIKAASARQAYMLLEQKAAPFAILYQSDVKPGHNFMVALIDEKLHSSIVYPFAACKNADPKKYALIKEEVLSEAFKKTLALEGFGTF